MPSTLAASLIILGAGILYGSWVWSAPRFVDWDVARELTDLHHSEVRQTPADRLPSEEELRDFNPAEDPLLIPKEDFEQYMDRPN